MLTKPLSELTDTELLDLLDSVSAEVKRRTSLSIDPDVDNQEALKRAADYFVTAVNQAITHR